MAKNGGYKVTITGTLPVDVSNIKELQKMAALIAAAEGGDAASVLKLLEDVNVKISDGSKPGKRKAKAGGKRRGRPPKQQVLPLEPQPGPEEPQPGSDTE